jgi:hypothetical protein
MSWTVDSYRISGQRIWQVVPLDDVQETNMGTVQE